MVDNKRAWTNNELEDLLRQLNLALEASGIGIWQHNIPKNQTRWDDQMKAIYGVEKQPLEVVWLDSVYPDDIASTNAVFQHAIETASDYASEFRIVRPDGSIRHLRSRAKYFVDAAGDPCFIGAEWDVTDDVLLNQELDKSRREARYAADHDHLTGLLNRRSFDGALINLQARQGGEVALCHIDIDRFKDINDRFGHPAGDSVLRHVSRILVGAIEPSDVAARLGGDEFAVLSVSGLEGAARLVSAIQSALEEPLILNGQPWKVECSIGVAGARSDETEKLLSHSDLALYQAKRSGRNRSQIFTDELALELMRERQLVTDLKRALSDGQIVPFYQVQVGARLHEIVGLEALARWNHPTRGILPPAEFMPAASAHGLLADIDEAILNGVLVDLRRWSRLGLRTPRVSVNLSAQRLADTDLIDRLRSLDLPPGKLSFELIETIFLDNLSDRVRDNIRTIRALGIEIEIDDLGSGHASLLGLLELRPDRVKIDRQLVAPILTSVPQRRLVRSLVDIAVALDIEVVAEGVETLEHAKLLSGLRVEVLQGFAFGYPVSAEETTERLRSEMKPKIPGDRYA